MPCSHGQQILHRDGGEMVADVVGKIVGKEVDEPIGEAKATVTNEQPNCRCSPAFGGGVLAVRNAGGVGVPEPLRDHGSTPEYHQAVQLERPACVQKCCYTRSIDVLGSRVGARQLGSGQGTLLTKTASRQ